MNLHQNLLNEPPETRLPDNAEAREALEAADDPTPVAGRFPSYSAAWARLAELALADNQPVTAYAYARTGYHRGLDQLRGSGWKGHGPIPWDHEPNRGFLRALHALAQASERIGDTAEAERCSTFLRESSAEADKALNA
ncbi:DUF3151 domain-containing protein [Nocardiopsis sp. HNM0947]|uniref:DUF3151 domain-containing protein n=1 Tax=Nocardiopsis coralli TaxID=2772213 RepID=A0ABR9PD43_9ACTN|nr:DUF3151 domain-containing protein [Nocardiopsis coralli]MBE3001748.1 DUF3151 domain-containing protein [Nocardiopsis coralli]